MALDDDVWPGIGAADLDNFYRELRRGIHDLEKSYASGRLAELVDDPLVEWRVGARILDRYRALLKGPRLPDPERKRLETVFELLDHAKAETLEIETWYNARLVFLSCPWVGAQPSLQQLAGARPANARALPRGEAAPPRGLRVLVETPDGEDIVLRVDQVVNLRFWGIGLVFDDESITDAFANLQAAGTAARFALDLTDLQQILQRILLIEGTRFPRLVPDRAGEHFEQLITDILNEECACARAARLIEDYSQKTDLRVRLPWLGRPRGARVQLTQIADRERHRRKLDEIREPEHLVFFSPLTVAEFLDRQMHVRDAAQRVLSASELHEFWAAFRPQPLDIDELAHALREQWVGSLSHAAKHPLGPLHRIPPVVRKVIRIFVAADAARATITFRETEREEVERGLPRRGRRGNTAVALVGGEAPMPDAPRPWRNLELEYSIGQRVSAWVKRSFQDGVQVVVSDATEGFVPKEELGFGEARTAYGYFEAGAPLELEVVAIEMLAQRLVLSRRALLPDPWAGAAISGLALGRVLHLAVRDVHDGGVRLEVLPGLDVWVHVGTATVLRGDEVQVHVAELDREARRVELVLEQVFSRAPEE
ncbi:MAG: hypothetical protein JNM84_00475 [Planctomycetes bacterium]|nr:hypothetical protein [Planctomycetota bacterium]